MRAASRSLAVLANEPRDARRRELVAALARHGQWPLVRSTLTTLQVNVGKRCNQACHHCHVEAGPKRMESMPREVAARVIELLARSPQVALLDITGGAPELHPSFRWLVHEARALGREVIDRCNLTILLEPGMQDLAAFLAEHTVRIVASLPCYEAKNVDAQRGRGVFEASIAALRELNSLGYGHAGSPLALDLVYNPGGAFLPPAQDALEAAYKDQLRRRYGIVFHRLFTLTNMPIKRFAQHLERSGQYEAYMALLVNHFNPDTVPGLMCRSLVSIGWDGRLYDCDFNQMLEIPAGAGVGSVWELDRLERLEGAAIGVGGHCFGCTAGAGSSCSGALAGPGVAAGGVLE